MRYEVDLVLGPCQYIGSKYFNQLCIPLFIHYIPIILSLMNLETQESALTYTDTIRKYNGYFLLDHLRMDHLLANT